MKRSKGFSLIELIIVISIIALLFGILLAAIQRIRASAALSSCLNKARQLNIALHGYHDQYGHFPSGIISADYPTTQPFMTWLTKLLPFVEEEPLWQKCLQAYEVDKNFEKPPHLEILGKKIKSYICSADPISQEPWNFQGQFTVAFTNYLV
ncbi:DUF1559 domain-containing protein [Telmatocola sphagniphila]|uniref:DUF1559 domain-containing protein n=1 Tax=Telmatocola sphagniphila TaxID=1123043 RepID=A0A8E6EUJ1_9BACT|nr:DUF1559 domain-containing protein [Telmatocola sphagniphila]QVL31480.1 DUF1559 domain-containing protein [Telmatocola sphagniphila]